MIANGLTYRDTVIYLDGSTFTNCTFERCRFIYSAQMGTHLDGNVYISCHWDFSGGAALTVEFISLMNASGASEVVDQIINRFKENKMPAGGRAGRH